MSEPDAIGEAVSGGLIGRAVEPRAGEVGTEPCGVVAEKAAQKVGDVAVVEPSKVVL